ncbi:MAG: type II toxin-antitoxin system HigB family toxin [Bacteroidetes bacterium]|nr:MAG: type II toxin-antitoxin system HigB family toxin [Bacteroidota bacterium]
MRIHLIKKQTIEDYVVDNAPGRRSFETWLTAIRYADWDIPEDIYQTFGSADLLGNRSNRVVFNIGGNNYRMICKYHFGLMNVHMWVCWIGTHTDYDELCDHREQYTINAY